MRGRSDKASQASICLSSLENKQLPLQFYHYWLEDWTTGEKSCHSCQALAVWGENLPLKDEKPKYRLLVFTCKSPTGPELVYCLWSAMWLQHHCHCKHAKVIATFLNTRRGKGGTWWTFLKQASWLAAIPCLNIYKRHVLLSLRKNKKHHTIVNWSASKLKPNVITGDTVTWQRPLHCCWAGKLINHKEKVPIFADKLT